MSSAKLLGRPPSPPHSTDGEVTATDSKPENIPREPYTPPRSIRPALNTDISLVSPPSTNHELFPRVQEHLPVQDHYGDPSIYQTAPSHPHYPVQPTFLRTMQYHTPPPGLSENGIQTRSGRARVSPLGSGNVDFSRNTRSSRLKKAPKNAKTGKSKGPAIDQPLSFLTADYKTPLKDMHAWVHRPVEERLKEVDNKKGYVSRPMNSFMLYRSAYAERVKQYCKENNHQVVSQVTGASWPLEPKEIREMYEQYAMIERDNHHAAHPTYKFAPNKNGKKRSHVNDDASDDDPDWEGSVRSAKRSRTSRRGESRSLSSTPFEGDRIPRHQMIQYHQPPLHPSSYQAVNPHGAPPMMVGPDGLVGQYYQTIVTPYGQHVDDVKFGRMDVPFPQYDMNASLVGLPNGTHHDLLAPHASPTMQVQMQGDVLDPRLAQFDPNVQYAQYEQVDPGYAMPQHYEFGSYGAQPGMIYPQDANGHPGMATLTDGRNVWTEADQVGSAFDDEFQSWN